MKRAGNNDDAVVRFKLTIAFDGTAYAGWQLQKNAMWYL